MTDLLKKILTVAAEAAILAGVVFFAWKGIRSIRMPSLRHTEIKIDLVLENVKKMAEYTAATYCADMMVSKTKGELFPGGYDSGSLPRLTRNDRYEVIVKGRASAVIDMSRAEFVQGDTLILKLPEPVIRVASPNPSDCKPFHHTGTWNETEIRVATESVVPALRKEASANHIIQEAEDKCRAQMTILLSSLGLADFEIVFE